MPIYAYKCESCGFAKDVLQKMSDPLLTDCPSCGTSAFKKQLTAAGFQLKGSGWYATDFKGGTSAPATASSSAPSAETASKDAAGAKPSESSATKTESEPPSASGGCGGSCACH
ncbi:FmdB family zinc ribbon protein [Rhodoferax ferrireducens]|uniref:FmdB family zinc ribbon protein n=1 Tax=Rhodoferax ferrireducens TaxID=192843 RepID=UPI000E0D00F1|nr:FmdB family zinc ribbon protein [Rhodoferax ferrireducens]